MKKSNISEVFGSHDPGSLLGEAGKIIQKNARAVVSTVRSAFTHDNPYFPQDKSEGNVTNHWRMSARAHESKLVESMRLIKEAKKHGRGIGQPVDSGHGKNRDQYYYAKGE